jgi:site-specific DNA recombinase
VINKGELWAAIVARVSTRGQKDNSSPDAQIERMRQACEARRIRVVSEFREVESGATIMSRAFNPQSPIYQTLRMAERGEINAVMFDLPDRLGRGDVIAQLELLYRLAGAQVIYAQPGRERDTLPGKVMHLADQLTSEVERDNIRRRLDGGKWARAREGRVIITATPPYGYRYKRIMNAQGRKIGATMRLYKNEVLVWLVGYHWLVGKVDAQGKSKYEDELVARGIAQRAREIDPAQAPRPASIHEVCRRFEVMGIPSPKGAPRWAHISISRMYRSKVYSGVHEYGKARTTQADTPKGKRKVVLGWRSADEVVAVPVPAVISMDAWRRLQAVLDEGAARNARPAKYEYLLRGCIRCAHCGYVMASVPVINTRSEIRSATLYYDCRWSRPKPEQTCHARRLPAKYTDRAVWDVVVGWLSSPATAAAVPGRREAGIESMQRTQAALRQQRAGLDKETARLLAFVRQATGRTMLAEARKQEAELERRIAAIDEQIAAIDEQIAAARRMQGEQRAAQSLREAMAGLISKPLSHAQKRVVIETMQVSAVWDSDAGALVILSPFMDQPEPLSTKPGKWIRF